jgi:hypothetical protein
LKIRKGQEGKIGKRKGREGEISILERGREIIRRSGGKVL